MVILGHVLIFFIGFVFGAARERVLGEIHRAKQKNVDTKD